MDRPTRRYISIADAAEYLEVSDRTVRRMIADRELTGYRMGRGRTLRVDLNEIDDNLCNPLLAWCGEILHRAPVLCGNRVLNGRVHRP